MIIPFKITWGYILLATGGYTGKSKRNSESKIVKTYKKLLLLIWYLPIVLKNRRSLS